MAKKKTGTNKSLAIRDYLASHPGAKPKEIVDALNSKGIKVSAQFVSTVKTNSKKRGPAKRRGRPVGSTNKTSAARKSAAVGRSADTVSVSSLIKLKRVVEEIGSIEEAKSALDTLEKLAT
jgi:hypothetical protein